MQEVVEMRWIFLTLLHITGSPVWTIIYCCLQIINLSFYVVNAVHCDTIVVMLNEPNAHLLACLLTYLLHGAESFLRS